MSPPLYLALINSFEMIANKLQEQARLGCYFLLSGSKSLKR